MAKQQQETANLKKVAIIQARYVDYVSKTTKKPVKGWFCKFLVMAWTRRPDGVQEMYYEVLDAKIQPENAIGDFGNPGIYLVETTQFPVRTDYGIAYQEKPVKIVEKVGPLMIDLL